MVDQGIDEFGHDEGPRLDLQDEPTVVELESRSEDVVSLFSKRASAGRCIGGPGRATGITVSCYLCECGIFY